VELKRHIGLLHACAIIIGNMAGMGIFITPTGILQGVGSVGLALIVWVVSGLFHLIFALCYAELGTALPHSGGDYIYTQRMLGPLAGFTNLYLVFFLDVASTALLAKTAALYVMQMMHKECYDWLLVMIGVLIHCNLCALNCRTVKGSAKMMVVFSSCKLLALLIIIIAGAVKLAKGNVSNFVDPFKGTVDSPGGIAVGFIAGFASYGGWSVSEKLSRELKNPKRDVPLSMLISITSMTTVYLIANVAYFSVLSPEQFLKSDAVALTFAELAIPSFVWVIPVAVALTVVGSLNAVYVDFSRFLFAGAKDGHFPEVVSYISVTYFTPLPATVIMCILGIAWTCATFLDIQDFIQMLGILAELRLILALTSVLILKYKHRELNKKSVVKVPIPVVLLGIAVCAAIIAFSIRQRPFTNGLGLGLCISAVPLYYI
ncbi:hypothetical protein CAPTEDRAFT_23875, partial [Capitella teleta]